jgi:hypothetical protein
MTAGAPLVPSIQLILGIAQALFRGERIAVEPFFCSDPQGGIDSLLWRINSLFGAN